MDSRRDQDMEPPDIVHRDGFLVMGTVTRRQADNEPAETVVSAWKKFERHRERIERDSVSMKYYGVSFAGGADGSFDYLTGMAVGAGAETPEGLEVRAVPTATYAVFACPVQSIGPTYWYIFSEWRPKSGYETSDGTPAFEEYPPATDPDGPVLLHIPIRERVRL
jgi:AraC family transcriptional regulator